TAAPACRPSSCRRSHRTASDRVPRQDRTPRGPASAGLNLGPTDPAIASRPDGPDHRPLHRPHPPARAGSTAPPGSTAPARPHQPTLRDNRPRQGRQMTTAQFRGVLAAVVTPFTADGSAVDVEGVRRQADHIISGGVNGLVPGGSTGEFTALTVEERKVSNRAYIEAAAGRVPVVAGTGALSTAETIELTRDAKDAGADAVMVVPPFYDAPDFDALIAHYSAITEAVDIPFMYYNIPAATGVELSSQQLGELGRRTGVTSYKDTGGDFPKFTEVHFDEAEDIQALNGW